MGSPNGSPRLRKQLPQSVGPTAEGNGGLRRNPGECPLVGTLHAERRKKEAEPAPVLEPVTNSTLSAVAQLAFSPVLAAWIAMIL